MKFYHMLAAHAESSINGLGYWLVPGNNWGNCLLLGVNGQGRLMHCTVLWGRLYCVVHTLTGEWGVIRPRQTSIHRELWRAMSRTLLYKEAAWGWIPVTSAMITHVPLHYWWLHTCPFITDDYTRAPSLLMITHVSLHYWCQPLNYNS